MDAEVKTRLIIEQAGDLQIFRDAATAVRDLVTNLQSLEATGATAFAPLLAQLDQLSETPSEREELRKLNTHAYGWR